LNALAILKIQVHRDCGKEFADNRRFTLATNIEVYFYDPPIPWQRGSKLEEGPVLAQSGRSYASSIPLPRFEPTRARAECSATKLDVAAGDSERALQARVRVETPQEISERLIRETAAIPADSTPALDYFW
jgi:hypothetical protein